MFKCFNNIELRTGKEVRLLDVFIADKALDSLKNDVPVKDFIFASELLKKCASEDYKMHPECEERASTLNLGPKGQIRDNICKVIEAALEVGRGYYIIQNSVTTEGMEKFIKECSDDNSPKLDDDLSSTKHSTNKNSM